MPSAEEDYLERAREIWERCQFYVYVGLAMILAVIAGFTLSHSAFDDKRDEANATLYQLVSSADAGELQQAQELHQTLAAEADFPELAYLGAFALASLHFAEGDYSEAADILRPALEGSSDAGLRHLAALRMAEALQAGGDYDEAVQLLQQEKPASGRIRVLFEERIGDAQLGAGDVVAAREAYSRAQDMVQEESALRFYSPVINIKLGALLSTPDAARALREAREAEIAEQEAAQAERAAALAASEGADDAALAPDLNADTDGNDGAGGAAGQ